MTGVDPDGAVVVITGASSGIGRATALALARRGAAVVLAARTSDDLDEVARQCRQHGADALTVPTNVTDADQVEALGRRAIERFGRFDAWINGAAVMAYGSFWDIPTTSYRAVVETNLFGTIYGSRVALHHFRDRGVGVLVNVGSLYGRVTTPYVGPYVLSKYAVRGFTQTLRQETAPLDGVDVCAVLPQAVDTPIFSHAANYTGRTLTALPLTVDPKRVVRAVVACVERPKPEVIVGWFGYTLAWGSAVLPAVYERLAPRVLDELVFGDEPSEASHGNLFEPMPELNRIDGGWRAERRWQRRAAAATAAVAAVVPVATWLWRRRDGG